MIVTQVIVGGRALVRQRDKLVEASSEDQVGERKLRIVQDEISKIQVDTKKRENTREPEVGGSASAELLQVLQRCT